MRQKDIKRAGITFIPALLMFGPYVLKAQLFEWYQQSIYALYELILINYKYCYAITIAMMYFIDPTRNILNHSSMKLFSGFLIAFLLCITQLSAQKKEVDVQAIKDYKKLGTYAISNDGKYIWYTDVSLSDGPVLHICTNGGQKKASFPHVGSAAFTEDSKYLVFDRGDSVILLTLSDMEERRIGRAGNVKVIGEGKHIYGGFLMKDTFKLKDLSGGEEKTYTGIKAYRFNEQGTVLVLQKDSSLIWINLESPKENVFFTGPEISNISFNSSGSHLVFSSSSKNSTAIYEYNPERKSSILLVSSPMPNTEVLNRDIRFSDDERYVFFKVKERKASPEADRAMITKGVNVWSYRDKDLQSVQMNNRYNVPEYMAVVDLDTRAVIRIENDSQTLHGQPVGEYAIVRNNISEFETYWNGELPEYWLVSLRTGTQKQFIPSSIQQPVLVSISSKGRYITWRDATTNDISCYSIETGTVAKIAAGIIADELMANEERKDLFQVAGWLKDDAAIIGYDNFDVWQIDPENKKKPIAITHGAGRRNGIQFRPLEVLKDYSATGLQDSLLLTALEVATKFNGFVKVKVSTAKDPGREFLGPFIYYFPEFVLDGYVPPPLKAQNTSAFLLQRQSDTSPSNILFTKDFHHFESISQVKPLMGYNGYTAELLKWTNGGGRQCYGVLYKPENLDTAKKYPVIFNYYEKRSYERYQYKLPALSATNINVPWYVSRGYAVFIPDIYPMRGKTGEVALETVESAARNLTEKYKWIDINRMGLQGHSHGGYLTNYITTHSRLFAAAQSSAGYSDFISGYGVLAFGGISMQSMQEVGQNNLGTAPFRNAQVYIDNSCIFTVDMVVTPLLLMHNKADDVVSFGQSIELFTALRRVNKPVWLLEYDNEDHVLVGTDHVLDFCTRQQQFFDHYLKGSPAPKWMTDGLPAIYKGLYSGLETDSTSKESSIGQ